MPGRISLDEAIASTQADPAAAPAGKRRITFEEASGALDASLTARPPGTGVSPGYPAGFEAAPTPGPPRTGQQSMMIRSPEPAGSNGFLPALKADIPQDEPTRLKVLAESLFPGDPSAINRVGFRDGRPVYVNDEGKLQYVAGKFSGGAASVAAYSPEIIGSTVGTVVGGPVVGSALGGAAGRAVKRGVSALAFDEPVTTGSVAKELGTEAVVNAAGGLLGKGVGGLIDRGRVVNFSAAKIAEAERTRELVRRQTGIELDLAQASGDRRLIKLRDYAARYPGESSQLIQAQDDVLSGQFDNATQRVLNLVAQPNSALAASQTGINAAQEVIKGARQGVYSQVRPLYEAAYAAVPQVTDPNLLKYLKLPYFGDALKAGRRLQALEGGVEATPAFINSSNISLKDLDYLKRGLDQKIEALATTNGRRQESAALRGKKNELVAELDTLSNDLYQQARGAYQQGIRQQVEPLEKGLVGALSKMDPQQANVASRLLGGQGVAPEGVALLKASLQRYSPDAYEGIVRQYLDDAYSQAQAITQGGDVVNVPGKFLRQLAPTPAKRNLLKAILPAGALPDFEALLNAAEKLAVTPLGASRVAGSNTAADTTISEILKGRGVAVTKALITPRQAIRDSVELKAQEDAVIRLTQALLDPAKRKQINTIVRMSDRSKQAILLGSLLSTQSAAGAVKDITENAGAGR